MRPRNAASVVGRLASISPAPNNRSKNARSSLLNGKSSTPITCGGHYRSLDKPAVTWGPSALQCAGRQPVSYPHTETLTSMNPQIRVLRHALTLREQSVR